MADNTIFITLLFIAVLVVIKVILEIFTPYREFRRKQDKLDRLYKGIGYLYAYGMADELEKRVKEAKALQEEIDDEAL